MPFKTNFSDHVLNTCIKKLMSNDLQYILLKRKLNTPWLTYKVKVYPVLILRCCMMPVIKFREGVMIWLILWKVDIFPRINVIIHQLYSIMLCYVYVMLCYEKTTEYLNTYSSVFVNDNHLPCNERLDNFICNTRDIVKVVLNIC